MSFQKTVIDKLDRIENKQVEHTVTLAVNNKILEEHHRRSTNLEARVIPIEQHVMFLNRSVKVLMAVIAAAASAATIVHYLVR